MIDTNLDCREIRCSDGVLHVYGPTVNQVWKVFMRPLVGLHDKALISYFLKRNDGKPSAWIENALPFLKYFG